jgi:hypothetical protein
MVTINEKENHSNALIEEVNKRIKQVIAILFLNFFLKKGM